MTQTTTPAQVGSNDGLGLAASTPKPRAWAIFTESGNARIWGTKQPHLQMVADEAGRELTPLYDQATLNDAYRRGFIAGQLDMRERA